VPVLDGQLGGDDRGVTFGPIVHDLQQVFAPVGLQGLQRPVIEDQDFDLGERSSSSSRGSREYSAL
jgi:hypothetical protein